MILLTHFKFYKYLDHFYIISFFIYVTMLLLAMGIATGAKEDSSMSKHAVYCILKMILFNIKYII